MPMPRVQTCLFLLAFSGGHPTVVYGPGNSYTQDM